jgi:hypothetical protein
MVPSSIPDTSAQRTVSSSYIYWPGAPDPWWLVLAPLPEPPAPEPRRPPMAPGDRRAALLNAEAYLDAALDAQVEGDDAGVRDALEVALASIQVALGSSSEHSVH